jgi:hypothetical protein
VRSSRATRRWSKARFLDDGAITGTFGATELFPVEIDLDALR